MTNTQTSHAPTREASDPEPDDEPDDEPLESLEDSEAAADAEAEAPTDTCAKRGNDERGHCLPCTECSTSSSERYSSVQSLCTYLRTSD